MHNQRLDSVTVRNAPVFKRKSDRLGPEDIVFRVGASIPVEEMDDIEVLFQGNPVDSTIQEEQHTLSLLQQRVGMQDFQSQELLQNSQATTALAIMAEGVRRFDDNIANVREWLGRIIMKALLLYQAYYPEGREVMVLGEDGLFVEQIWTLPKQWLYKGIGVQVTATTSSTSKELERQNKLSLFGLLTQYYGNLTQYAVQAQNPQFPEPVRLIMLKIVESLTTLVEDILEDFEIRNAAELAITFDSLRQGIEASRESALAQGAPAPPGLPPGTGSAAGTPGQPAGATGPVSG